MAVVSKEDLFALKGKDIGTSEWMLIDQDRVNLFADATGDHHIVDAGHDGLRGKMHSLLRGTALSINRSTRNHIRQTGS